MKYKIQKNYIVEADDPIAARVKFSEAVQKGTEDTYFESVFIRELPEQKPAGLSPLLAPSAAPLGLSLAKVAL